MTAALRDEVAAVVRKFVQEILDDPATGQTPALDARALWSEALEYVFRILSSSRLDETATRRSLSRLRADLEAIPNVFDLGRLYEALLELEPGITSAPMCRLRRRKLEIVVPIADKPRHERAKVQWLEDIPPNTFYLRSGLGRKTSGSYYSPPELVEYLVRQTLAPQVQARSSVADPRPLAILELKILDPAMGAGYFLVEACRFLGERLYEACKQCDELATQAESCGDIEGASQWRSRISGLSVDLVHCKRLVAARSLYGVDKNPHAVLLARLFLDKETHAPGLPSIDLHAHLLCGDSLTGVSAEQPHAIVFHEAFPEVFPLGKLGGFDAVLGNPPWDRLLPSDKEFFAAYDLRVLDAPTKRQIRRIADALCQRPDVARAYAEYVEQFRQLERIVRDDYRWQHTTVSGKRTIGKLDAYRLFMERAVMLLGPSGRIGLVVPSAFHTNEGATAIRRLYLEQLQLVSCFSFENQRRIFDIHGSFKFDLVVARRRTDETNVFRCAFYLHEPAWLHHQHGALEYSVEFVRRTTGEHLALLELRSPLDVRVAEICFSNATHMAELLGRMGIHLGRELNMTDDASRFIAAKNIIGEADARDPVTTMMLEERGYTVLHEGKTFHQYDDHWESAPRFVVARARLEDKPSALRASRFFRLAFRAVARSTDERTAIFSIIPPNAVFGNSGFCERMPWARPTWTVLALLAIANSFCFDWVLRQRTSANVNLFILDRCPLPTRVFEPPLAPFVVHAALRLSCNHEGYAPLWTDLLGAEWREARPKYSWPVIDSAHERWMLRARVDAVIAHAYGLERAHYAHVLSTFRHKAYADAPQLCLAAFDELAGKGIDWFVREYDEYSNLPLNDQLPAPIPPNDPRHRV